MKTERLWFGSCRARPGGYFESAVRIGRRGKAFGFGTNTTTAAVDAVLGAAFGGGRIAIA